MRFDKVKQRGVHCKELGPNVAISVEPSASYNDLIDEGKKLFFPRKDSCGPLKINCEYFLADAQGSKLPCEIKGRSWSLYDYLHVHGYYPSKTKIFCVQVCYKFVHFLVIVLFYQREHLDQPTSTSLSAHPTRKSIVEIPSQGESSKAAGSSNIGRSKQMGSRQVEESHRIEVDDSDDVREKSMAIASKHGNELGI